MRRKIPNLVPLLYLEVFYIRNYAHLVYHGTLYEPRF